MAEMTMSYQGGKYGAVELKAVYQKYWSIALGIAVALHLLILGTYYLVEILGQEEAPPISVRIMKYSDLGPPPSIANANIPPPIAVSAPVAKPTVGAPVPVPDAEVSAEQTLATQTEMSQTVAPIGEGAGEGSFAVEQDILIQDDGPPADFVAVEKEPQIVKKVEPKYPELAMRAGLEGKVWVKIWVDKEGKAKQVVVLKSDAEIFNEPAVEAAKQFVFTPAYMNNGPVSVWVSVPFKFKLAERK
ncbi:MAG TPA: TonB family protein [Bacteroidota bacterium]|jgi:protein TonB|nr:TonB family protein [Bacteroidota bacterium]